MGEVVLPDSGIRVQELEGVLDCAEVFFIIGIAIAGNDEGCAVRPR